MSDDAIPVIEVYRDCPIHDMQSSERVAEVVKPAVDAVIGLEDAEALAEYCLDTTWPPEARQVTSAKVATAARRALANVELGPIRAQCPTSDCAAVASPTSMRGCGMCRSRQGIADRITPAGTLSQHGRGGVSGSPRERAEADEAARGKPLARTAEVGK